MEKFKHKAIAWIDVDDVLVNFKLGFNKYLAARYGLKIAPDYEPPDTNYGGALPMGIDWVINDMPKDWPADLEAFTGAAKFIQELRKLGCRIVLVTSINQVNGPYRIQNLEKHGIEFDEIYFTKGLSKGKVAQSLRSRYEAGLHIFVDDMAKNCVEFSNDTKVDALFTLDIPYNKEILENRPMILAFKNIDELYQEVIESVKRYIK